MNPFSHLYSYCQEFAETQETMAKKPVIFNYKEPFEIPKEHSFLE